MIDYEQLKLDDPGGDLETALATLSTITTTVPHEVNRIFDRDVYTALGAMEGEVVLQAIEAQAEDGTDPYQAAFIRVLKWISPGAEHGIDICDTEVQGVLNSLVGKHGVTQPMIDAVISLKDQIVIKYPGLRKGDVEYARAN